MPSTIVAAFASLGIPATGLSATIRIRRTDTQALVITDAAMTEQGDGAYSFDFAPIDGLEYSIRADGGATLPNTERFAFGSVSGTTEARHEVDIPRLRYLGSVWIDTANGAAGTVVGVNGLPDNPVTTLADALSLTTAMGLRSLTVVTGNLLLTASLTEFFVTLRDESELDFGGQNVNGTELCGGVLKGAMTGVITARDCLLEDVSGLRGLALRCGLMGMTTLGAGTTTLAACRSNMPGTASPTLAFGSPTAACNLRGYSGGLQVEDMTVAAHIMTAEFIAGQIVVDSSCTGGTLVIRGVVGPITDSSVGTAVIRIGALLPKEVSEVYRYLGLELGVDSVHTPTSIVAGDVSQTISIVATTITKTRDP